jgi:quercetin dioxygenase-like cupin family protein
MVKSTFKNLPVNHSKKLNDLIDVEKNQVISMAIAKGNNVQAMLLGLSKGELISDEEYFGDTVYYVIDGKINVVKNNVKIELNKNDIIMVKEHEIHALEIEEDTKLMQMTMINMEEK